MSIKNKSFRLCSYLLCCIGLNLTLASSALANCPEILGRYQCTGFNADETLFLQISQISTVENECHLEFNMSSALGTKVSYAKRTLSYTIPDPVSSITKGFFDEPPLLFDHWDFDPFDFGPLTNESLLDSPLDKPINRGDTRWSKSDRNSLELLTNLSFFSTYASSNPESMELMVSFSKLEEKPVLVVQEFWPSLDGPALSFNCHFVLPPLPPSEVPPLVEENSSSSYQEDPSEYKDSMEISEPDSEFALPAPAKSETVQKGGKYRCPYPGCGRTFSQSGGLVAHKLAHSGEKPYSCPKCEKRFVNASNLKRHILHHNQVRYYCDFPGCGKSYSRKGTLKKHMQDHTE
jgi:hypothetical protein